MLSKTSETFNSYHVYAKKNRKKKMLSHDKAEKQKNMLLRNSKAIESEYCPKTNKMKM